MTKGNTLEVQCPIYYVPSFKVTWTKADGAPLPSHISAKDNVLRFDDHEVRKCGNTVEFPT